VNLPFRASELLQYLYLLVCFGKMDPEIRDVREDVSGSSGTGNKIVFLSRPKIKTSQFVGPEGPSRRRLSPLPAELRSQGVNSSR